MEKISKLNTEAIEHKAYNLEEVVTHVQEANLICKEQSESPRCDTALLHREIEGTEIAALFKTYEEHQILTLDDITTSIANITRHLNAEISGLNSSDEGYRFAEEKLKLLNSRVHELRTSVRKYIRTLSQFFQIQKQRIRLEPEDFQERLLNLDRQRRMAHNSLIESLSVYSQTVIDLKNYGFLEKLSIISWNHGIDMSAVVDPENTLSIFSSQILSDRDLVKDWAISVHLAEQLQQIENIKNGTTEAPLAEEHVPKV